MVKIGKHTYGFRVHSNSMFIPLLSPPPYYKVSNTLADAGDIKYRHISFIYYPNFSLVALPSIDKTNVRIFAPIVYKPLMSLKYTQSARPSESVAPQPIPPAR